jgi:hypothetical protein
MFPKQKLMVLTKEGGLANTGSNFKLPFLDLLNLILQMYTTL